MAGSLRSLMRSLTTNHTSQAGELFLEEGDVRLVDDREGHRVEGRSGGCQGGEAGAERLAEGAGHGGGLVLEDSAAEGAEHQVPLAVAGLPSGFGIRGGCGMGVRWVSGFRIDGLSHPSFIR